MDRRTFLKLTGSGVLVVGSGIGFTSCAGLRPPDANGLQLLSGFTSRKIATTGETVGATSYVWHTNPDGGEVFPATDGGWIYVSNSESVPGGASMIQFAADGAIVDAKQILGGTIGNCAGGATPWGTWLSCEEYDGGRVHECDPTGAAPGVVRPAMGTFKHEATAVDHVGQAVYLTEDVPDGALYRFRPTTWADLSAGVLEAMTEVDGILDWAAVTDPTAATTPTRYQVANARRFNGAEGTVQVDESICFTTKGDNKVWRYRPATNALSVVYDAASSAIPVLTGVDNITALPNGDLFVAEDPGDLQIVRLRTDGRVEPVVQLTGVAGTEITGPAFSPDLTRLYFSSQRNPGTTFEVTGPF